MAINLVPILMGVGSKLASKLVEIAITKLLTERVMIRILIAVGDKIFLSTKNKLDDKVWQKDIKPALEAEIESEAK